MTKQFDLPINCIFNTERDNIEKENKEKLYHYARN